jgi:hypothetical protein
MRECPGHARRCDQPPQWLTRRQTTALLEEIARIVQDDPVEVTASVVTATLVMALRRVGVHGAIVHAFAATGMLVSEDNLDLWTPAELAWWEAALGAWPAISAPSGAPAPARSPA